MVILDATSSGLSPYWSDNLSLRAGGGSFVAELEGDAFGLVRGYRRCWQAEATT
jgi:hypothetical protein